MKEKLAMHGMKSSDKTTLSKVPAGIGVRCSEV